MEISQIIPQASAPTAEPQTLQARVRVADPKNWKTKALGTVDGVSELIRKDDTIPEHWKAALLAEIAGIQKPNNFVRLDVHGIYHDGQTVLHFHLVPSQATI